MYYIKPNINYIKLSLLIINTLINCLPSSSGVEQIYRLYYVLYWNITLYLKCIGILFIFCQPTTINTDDMDF